MRVVILFLVAVCVTLSSEAWAADPSLDATSSMSHRQVACVQLQ
jgi:hypothetical protein